MTHLTACSVTGCAEGGVRLRIRNQDSATNHITLHSMIPKVMAKLSQWQPQPNDNHQMYKAKNQKKSALYIKITKNLKILANQRTRRCQSWTPQSHSPLKTSPPPRLPNPTSTRKKKLRRCRRQINCQMFPGTPIWTHWQLTSLNQLLFLRRRAGVHRHWCCTTPTPQSLTWTLCQFCVRW